MPERPTSASEAAWQTEVQELVLVSGATVAPELRGTWALWLAKYVEGYNRVAACRAVGVTLAALERWAEQYPSVWPRLLASAESAVADAVAGEMWRRGVNGVARGVWHQGKLVGTELHHSDRALEMLAKRTDPVGWGVREADRPHRGDDPAALVRAILASPEALVAARELARALEESRSALALAARRELASPRNVIDVQGSNDRSDF